MLITRCRDAKIFAAMIDAMMLLCFHAAAMLILIAAGALADSFAF